MNLNKVLRGARGDLSTWTVARKAGLAPSTVLYLESGGGTVDSFIRLVEDGLGRNVGELFLHEIKVKRRRVRKPAA